jgi:hypothetical protein
LVAMATPCSGGEVLEPRFSEFSASLVLKDEPVD